MDERTRILAVIAADAVFELIEPLLARSRVEVIRVRSGQHGRTLARDSRFDLIVAQHPLPDLEFSEFYGSLRVPESSSCQSPLVILTRDDRLERVDEYLEGSRTQACCIDSAPGQIQLAMAELMGLAERANARIGVRLSAQLSHGSVALAGETVNVSEGGLLVGDSQPLPVGTKVSVTLYLTDGEEIIEGIGRVVRHAGGGTEPVQGMAIQFLRLDQADRERLAEFVKGET